MGRWGKNQIGTKNEVYVFFVTSKVAQVSIFKGNLPVESLSAASYKDTILK